MAKVILYSQTNCPPCIPAKMRLDNSDIEYDYVLLGDTQKPDTSPEKEDFIERGGRSTPSIEIDGEILPVQIAYERLGI